MYELLIKGGLVIDPAHKVNGQRDIGISRGKIATIAPDIAPGEAIRVIDARGKIVTPGLIDIHAHVAGGIVNIAVPPDESGVLAGVTMINDAGSTGYANLPAFRRFVIHQARTDIFCFLHMSSTGLAVMPEIWSWPNINTEAMLKTIEENRDLIKGVKIRAIAPVMQNLGVEAIRVAKKVATEAGLPLMIHLGVDTGPVIPEDTINAFTRGMLAFLDKGDILSHVYTSRAGGVISGDGNVLPEFKEAIARGVVLDVAQGAAHWSLEIFKKGLERGILPTTISTDLGSLSIKGPVFSLVATMSRFLALGLTLEQVIAMTTINPARVLGQEGQRGNLGTGMPADISIMELTEGDFLFSDSSAERRTFKGNLLLVPRLTLKSGVVIEALPSLPI